MNYYTFYTRPPSETLDRTAALMRLMQDLHEALLDQEQASDDASQDSFVRELEERISRLETDILFCSDHH